MGPYRTPAAPPRGADPPRDREDLIVHAVIAALGVIGILAGAAALGVLLLLIGGRAAVRCGRGDG